MNAVPFPGFDAMIDLREGDQLLDVHQRDEINSNTIIRIHEENKYFLPWPPNYVVTTGDCAELDVKRDILSMINSQLIDYNNTLVLVGYAHPCHRKPNVHFDPFLIYIKNGNVLALDTTSNVMYCVAYTDSQFVAIGLRNFPMFYDACLSPEMEVSWFGKVGCDVRELLMIQRNPKALQRYVINNSGRSIRVDAFGNHTLAFASYHDIKYVYGEGILDKLIQRRYIILGTGAKCNFEPNCRSLVLMGENLQIYIFRKNQVRRVASSLRRFVRLGFRELDYAERHRLNSNDDNTYYFSNLERRNLDRILNNMPPLRAPDFAHREPTDG